MNDLAFFSGIPSIPEEFQNSRHPNINVIETDIYNKLNDEMISYNGGNIFFDLEYAFSKTFELTNCLSFNSGTSALFALYYGSLLNEGDEVLVPGYTFFATATPLFLLGCKPVLVDCCENGNISPEDIKEKITSKTKAIIVTHIWGIPCEMDIIKNIAEEYKLILLEDASHAHGASYDGKKVGTWGDGAGWSLGAKKLITGGQGGMLSTPHRDVYERALLLGHFNQRPLKEIKDIEFSHFSTTGTGLNLRMHPYAAATILEQLRNYNKDLQERREVASFLIDSINNIEGLSTPSIPIKASPSWYSFPIFYNKEQFLGLKKEIFVDAIQKEGAIQVDIPTSTCTLDNFYPFQVGFTGRKIKKLDIDPKSLGLSNCQVYEDKLFKMPTWYGPNRFKYAEYYIEAIKKVALMYKKLL